MNRIITLCVSLILSCVVGVQVFAQDGYEVNGIIADSKGPIEGAVVLEKGTETITMTDKSGKFSLEVSDSAADIEVRHSGYQTKTYTASEMPSNIVLDKEPEKLSYFKLAKEGGFLMIVLLILSIIAIYIFGSKWWMIHKASKVDKFFIQNIRDLIHDGKINAAKELCQRYDNPTARLLEKGIERIGRPLEDIQTAVENMGNVEVARLEKGLPMLATIAGGAPMIGFLGTVTGMIAAFFQMANATSGNIDINLLSGGIYEAMVTTVAGLFVGIIAYFGYNYLTSQISNLVIKMENATIAFIDMLHEPADK